VRYYRSKVDFLTLLLLVVAVFMVDTAAMALSMEAVARYYPVATAAAFLAVVSFAAVLLLFVFPVRYMVDAAEVRVRSGLLRWRISVAHLHAARPVRNVWPAPALSSQRLVLEYSRGDRVRRLYVSPRDPEGFLADLVGRDPGLHLEGEEVVRRSGDVLRL
jgi:hypothetical protein